MSSQISIRRRAAAAAAVIGGQRQTERNDNRRKDTPNRPSPFAASGLLGGEGGPDESAESTCFSSCVSTDVSCKLSNTSTSEPGSRSRVRQKEDVRESVMSGVGGAFLFAKMVGNEAFGIAGYASRRLDSTTIVSELRPAGLR